jgi:DNA helicase IV
MVTQELLLKIIYELNQRKANTSLALIGCILKGDRNSICTNFDDLEEFGKLDDKSLQNMGEVFDDLIDKKLIIIIQKGLQKKYDLSEKGLKVIEDPDFKNEKEKYFSSIGSPTDYVEESVKLDNTISKIDAEINLINNHKMYKDVKEGDTASDYADLDDLLYKKKMNKRYEDETKNLNDIKKNPYFGRMDLIEHKDNQIDILQLYIGNHGLRLDHDELILDWRSRIASYYYDTSYRFNLNQSHYELQLKRKIDIADGKIKSLYNEVTKKKSELKDTISDPFLVNVLTKKKDTKYFTDIIATIQEKQNEIIRLPLESNLIVQGCAGSGKTMILLHRLSYILFHNKKLNPKMIKVITPSKMFDDFVDDLSMKLGLNDIERFSMTQFYIDHIEQHYPQNKVSKLENESKLDSGIIKEIYSIDFIEKIILKIKENMHGDVEDMYQKSLSKIQKTHEKYLNLFSEKDIVIQSKLIPHLNVIKKQLVADHPFIHLLSLEGIEEFRVNVSEVIKANQDVEGKISTLRTSLDLCNDKAIHIAEILNDDLFRTLINKSNTYKIKLFSNDKVSTEEFLNSYKRSLIDKNNNEIKEITDEMHMLESKKVDEKHLLVLKKIISFIENKVDPILDEIYEYDTKLKNYNENEYLIYEKKIKDLDDHINSIKSYLNNYYEDKGYIKEIISSMDLDTQKDININRYFEEIVIKEADELFNNKGIKVKSHNQYKYYYYLKLSVLQMFSYKFDPLSIIMIDEAQEYSMTEIMLLKNIHPSSYMNFYGDIKQLSSHVGLESWDKLKIGHKYYELNENYRNPKPIVEYINQDLKTKMIPLGLDNGNIISNVLSSDPNIDAFLFSEKDKDMFISKYKHLINKIDVDKLIEIDEAKGLEFNTVVIFSKNMTENQKYIGFSRSLENLYIFDE